MKELVSDRQPIISVLLIILIILIFGFIAIGHLVGLEIATLIYDGNFQAEIQKRNPNPDIFFPALVMAGVASLVGLIVFPILYLKFLEHRSIVPFFQKKENWTSALIIIPILGICFMIAISPITEWNVHFQFPEIMKSFGDWAREQEDKLTELTKLLTNFDSSEKFVLGLVVIAILPGIGEELVFRGLIQNELWRSSKNIHAAIWTSAILFSVIHMQFFGFMPRMLLGALFGYLYYWSGNLLIPMIAHFFHNGFTLSMIYLYTKGSIDINIDSEESAPLPLVALCAVFTFALLYYFKKHYTNQEPQPL